MLCGRRNTTKLLVTVALLVSMVAGCGGGFMGSMLKVTGVSALLSDHHSSSIIRILADVTGDGIRKVIAYVKRIGDNDSSPVELIPTLEGKYEGTFETEEPQGAADEYTIVIQATDNEGRSTTSEPVTVEVPAPSGEPE